MDKKRRYDEHNRHKNKKPRVTSSVNNKYIKRLNNVFTSNELLILTDDAMKHIVSEHAKHGDDSSKRFCFNALTTNADSDQLNHVERLFGQLEWHQLDLQVKTIVTKAVKIAIKETTSNDITLVCFELIYIPLNGKSIPGLEWHTDEGYTKTGEPFCYADTTTVFMLTNPQTWQGGNLQICDNNNHYTYKYEYNSAIMFVNKKTQHRVTRIRPIKLSSRIVLIVSVYGNEETLQYRLKHI